MSVSENIDKTPSGMLLHGIMSSIAEFYSQNLAAEISKGTETKVQRGGTTTVAPIGYLNVRHIIDGCEVRTVEVTSSAVRTSGGPSSSTRPGSGDSTNSPPPWRHAGCSVDRPGHATPARCR